MRYLSTLTARLARDWITRLVGVLLVAACADASSPTAGSSESARSAEARGASNHSIVISPATLTLEVGDTAHLSATVLNPGGRRVNDAIIAWTSSQTATATVSATGVVTGIGAGSATITATSDGASSSVEVLVTALAVDKILISPSVDTLVVGAEQQLTATLYAASGAILTSRPISWASSSATVATVDTVGLVIARAAGTAVISASSEGQTGSATIVVTASAVPITGPGTVTDLAVTDRTTSTLTLSFTAVGDGAGGGASYVMRAATPTLNWGSTPNVTTGTCAVPIETVAVGALQSCTVIELVAGAAYEVQLVAFRGTWGSVEAFGELSNVASGSTLAGATPPSPAPVASVTLNPTSASIAVGSTTTFAATLRDSAGNVLTDRIISWTSGNTSIATVVDGLATGVAAGTTSITATSEGRSANAELTVTAAVLSTEGITTRVIINWTSGTGTFVLAWTDGSTNRNVLCDPSTVNPIVISAQSEGWSGPGNVLRMQNTTAGCGGLLLQKLMPAPTAGTFWTLRWSYKQSADQIRDQQHTIVGFAPSGTKIVLNRTGRNTDGNWNHTLGLAPANFGWNARNADNSANLQFAPDTWYRFEMAIRWYGVDGGGRPQYRLYPRVYNSNGVLIADETRYRAEYVAGQQVNQLLSDFYAGGGYLSADASSLTSDVLGAHIRDFWLGLSRSYATNSGHLYWAGIDVGTAQQVTYYGTYGP